VNFREVAEFRGEFGERIGGIGQSVLFGVRGAELRRRVWPQTGGSGDGGAAWGLDGLGAYASGGGVRRDSLV